VAKLHCQLRWGAMAVLDPLDSQLFGSWSRVQGFTCLRVHLSMVWGFTCSDVPLSEGSFIRGFTCRYFSSTMTFIDEIEAMLMKRILYQFGVTTSRGCHSQGDAVLLKKYLRAMLFCWSIVAKLPLRFCLYFSFCSVVI